METIKIAPRIWIVKENDTALAEITLDALLQMADVILRTDDPAFQRKIKELALSHVAQYQRTPANFNARYLSVPWKESSKLTDKDSDAAMSFDRIPDEIKQLTDEQLDGYLSRCRFVFVQARFVGVKAVLDQIVADLKHRHGIKLTYKTDRPRFDATLLVNFTVKKPYKFRLWKNVDTPSAKHTVYDPWWLHITPSYHPCLMGAKSAGLINGDTDAFIGSDELGIDSIYSPPESRKGPGKSFIMSTWNDMKHPFYAEGRMLGIRIAFIRILSGEAYKLLLNTILASLNLENTYLAVSGGFNPPFPYPRQPRGHREVRGSEHAVAWEFHTLNKEKKLNGSFIPAWFNQENWIEVYPTL